MNGLLSPVSGRPLAPDTPHSLRAGDERWPMIDGIAYLRAGSRPRAEDALALLDRGDRAGALHLLLAEQDRWWDGALPQAGALADLVERRDQLTLREAMEHLAYGRVGDYFAHRWSDPTFVAGLALMDACWPHPRTVFELGCGIGHYLRELRRLGVVATGADIVFSKLWLARHWVVGPDAPLVCMDAAQPFAVAGPFDLALCHDAFYFFEDKAHVARSLRALAPRLLLAHIHNRDAANLSSAAAVAASDLAGLFPGAMLFADEELTRAGVAGDAPLPLSGATEAFAVSVPPAPAGKAFGRLACPPDGTPLRRNPLLGGNGIDWPSARYAAEYGARATYRADAGVPPATMMRARWREAVARRELLDLPERW